jgi:hypothetical protein
LWILVVLSVPLGLLLLWTFGKLSNQAAIAETKRHLQARLYELRLFSDEPKLVWQAQTGLFRANLRYFRLVLVPVALLSIPMWLVFGQLRAVYDWSPLTPGKVATITMQWAATAPDTDEAPALILPQGFVVDSPPVRVIAKRQVSWRVRPAGAASGLIRVQASRDSVSKTISADGGVWGWHYLSKRRGRMADFLNCANEPPIVGGSIEWVEVDYPDSNRAWILWLIAGSTLSAFLFRKRAGVLF